MNRQDRVVRALRKTAIDDFLHAALHFRIAALYRREIEIFVAFAAGHRRRRAAAETDQHRRAAEHDDIGARRNIPLVYMFATDRADPACDHDRFVVTAQFGPVGSFDPLFVAAKVTAGVRPAELVVERRRADRALEHDLERRGDAFRLAVIAFPGLFEARNPQVRHRKSAQAGLRLRADAGRALVAYLAAGTGRRARKRRNRGWMVMRFDLHQYIELSGLVGIGVVLRAGGETLPRKAFDHGGIVVVGGQYAPAMPGMRVANHAEQRMILRVTVDGPARVKNLVPAMLGIGLGEHHQLDVAGITSEIGVGRGEVFDLVCRQGETQVDVGLQERACALPEHIDFADRCRRLLGKQRRAFFQRGKHAFDHAIVQQLERYRVRAIDLEEDTALDTPDLSEATIVRDIGRLARPWRYRAGTRHDVVFTSLHVSRLLLRAIGQQAGQDALRIVVERRFVDVHEVHIAAVEGTQGHPRID